MNQNQDQNSPSTPSGRPSQTELAPADTNPPASPAAQRRPCVFPLGQVVVTTNAAAQVPNLAILLALGRHVCGDWGEVCPEDWQANDEALQVGNRLHSVYRTPAGLTFWILTEWDRSVTTILMPEDY